VTFASLIEDTIGRLNKAGIAYMVTGSVASSYYGEPRATRDLDIVIDPEATSLDMLVDGLIADGFYVDRHTVREALTDRTQFNAIGPEAFKIDFVIRKTRPFSLAEFERRRPADLLGTPGFVPSVEDLIVAKLEWAAASGSERQLRDVAGILAVSGNEVDHVYLGKWIKSLRLEPTWNEVSDESG
jgi:hypothetical protein